VCGAVLGFQATAAERNGVVAVAPLDPGRSPVIAAYLHPRRQPVVGSVDLSHVAEWAPMITAAPNVGLPSTLAASL
jgi:hypothetical protein